MKRLGACALTIALTLSAALAGCSPRRERHDGFYVVTTLFPTYDFARAIAGGRAEVELLLTPGRESHSYEPSTGDVISINECDVFVYTSPYMEPWVSGVLEGISGPAVVNASDGLELSHDRDHDDGHGHDTDPHIWTDPVMCLTIVDNILAAFVERDGENAGFYRENARALKDELLALDADFREIAASARDKTIYHGGRFSMNYFLEEYGLNCVSAYDSCSSDTEPSVRTVCAMIDEMREKGVKAVFYEELSNNSVARLIADETGAEPLLLHSCHNLTGEELEAGATYVELMKKNAENLREALL